MRTVTSGRDNSNPSLLHDQIALASIHVRNWRPDRRSTRAGFIDVEFPSIGLTIRQCAVHELNGKQWVSMPSREFQGHSGALHHEAVVVFDKSGNERLKQAVLDQLRAMNALSVETRS